jgi:hypothetical protein
MKFLALAYGDGRDFEVLSKEQRDALLAQDEVLRQRRDLVASVENKATTLTAWDGNPSTADGPFTTLKAPVAGFGIIEAAVTMECRLRGRIHPHSSELLNARTLSTGSRGLLSVFPEAGRPTVSIMTGT